MTLTTFAIIFISIFSVIPAMIGYMALIKEKHNDK